MDKVDQHQASTKALVELETAEAKLMMQVMTRKKERKSKRVVSRLTSAQPKTVEEHLMQVEGSKK